MNFSFTEQEVNTILQALGEQPAKLTIGVILKIQQQAQMQMQAAQAPVEAGKPNEGKAES